MYCAVLSALAEPSEHTAGRPAVSKEISNRSFKTLSERRGLSSHLHALHRRGRAKLNFDVLDIVFKILSHPLSLDAEFRDPHKRDGQYLAIFHWHGCQYTEIELEAKKALSACILVSRGWSKIKSRGYRSRAWLARSESIAADIRRPRLHMIHQDYQTSDIALWVDENFLATRNSAMDHCSLITLASIRDHCPNLQALESLDIQTNYRLQARTFYPQVVPALRRPLGLQRFYWWREVDVRNAPDDILSVPYWFGKVHLSRVNDDGV